jgi:hypothetical protein
MHIGAYDERFALAGADLKRIEDMLVLIGWRQVEKVER